MCLGLKHPCPRSSLVVLSEAKRRHTETPLKLQFSINHSAKRITSIWSCGEFDKQTLLCQLYIIFIFFNQKNKDFRRDFFFWELLWKKNTIKWVLLLWLFFSFPWRFDLESIRRKTSAWPFFLTKFFLPMQKLALIRPKGLIFLTEQKAAIHMYKFILKFTS